MRFVANARLKLSNEPWPVVPSLSIRANGVLPVIEVDESDLGTDATGNAADRNGKFRVDWGTDSSGNRGKASSITLSVASETGVDSGVIDAATGARVFLFQSSPSGEIVGRVGTRGADGAADPNGAVAVSAVDLVGNIKLDQKRALKHGDPNNANEFVSLAADSIVMTATITDSDGDSASIKLGDKINAGGSSSPLSIQASGRDATISLGGTVKAILKGVSANQVSLSNFEFDNKLEDLASTLGTDAF